MAVHETDPGALLSMLDRFPFERPMLLSALAGTIASQGWADSTEAPRAALLATSGEIAFLSGDPAPGILQDLLDRIPPGTGVVAAPGAIERESARDLAQRGFKPVPRQERRLVATPRDPATLGPPDVTARDIAADDLKNVPFGPLLLRAYGGARRYLESGFGVVLERGECRVAAGAAFYIAGGEADIAGRVEPAARGTRIGSRLIAHLIGQCRAREVAPYISQETGNRASTALVEAAGFGPPIPYTLWIPT